MGKLTVRAAKDIGRFEDGEFLFHESDGFQMVGRNGKPVKPPKTYNKGSRSVAVGKPRVTAGFPVFVDFISKKVPKQRIREVFEQFGIVLDVYIVYHNNKRANFNTTFGFVRFKTWMNMKKAVDEADGLEIEGFKIKVFDAVEKYVKNGNKEGAACSNDQVGLKAPSRLMVQPRSKDQILSMSYKDMVEADSCGERRKATVNGNEQSPVDVAFPSAEMKWVSACMTGIVKEQFNYGEAEDGLKEDGVNCIIMPWGGLSVIMRFESQKSRDNAFKFKKDAFYKWFDEFSVFSPGDLNPKYRVWMVLANVPLTVWHESFFETLGKRWGKVLKIDQDTVEKRRFDEAKILIELNDITKLPSRLIVNGNGESRIVRVWASPVPIPDGVSHRQTRVSQE